MIDLMGVLARWSLLLFVLQILVSRRTESRQIVRSFEKNHHGMSVNPSISNMDIKTLQRSWVFEIKDMKAGERKAIYFPRKEESVNGRFIPREKADSIPFSRKDLPKILDFFGYAPGTPEAAKVESALENCEAPPASEVFKACFTSFESMLEAMFRAVFEIPSDSPPSQHPSLRTSVFRGAHETSFQNYTILEGGPREVPTTAMAGCHVVPYPYAVYYCHVQPGETKVFEIPLLGDDGVRVDAVAACHLDTSQWDPESWAFLTLGTKPGDPVCHVFPPYDNFAWFHTPNFAKASE